jgi:hypothetical protein
MSARLPGRTVGRTVTGRTILRDTVRARHEAMIIDGTYSYDGANTSYPYELQAGCLMAVITASGKYCPLKRTVLAADASTSDTEVVVDDARFFKAGDPIKVSDADADVVDSIDYDTNTITLVTGLSGDVSTDEVVVATGALAGAETAVGILDEFVDLEDAQTQVVGDRQSGKLIVQGFVLDAMVLGDLAAARADTSNQLSLIHFQDQFQ